MIEFLNPALLGGLVLIATPVIVHLIHRRKVKRLEWGAMRFLHELLARRRRRMMVDNLLLLLVRILIILLVALALLRPNWVGDDGSGGRELVRDGRVAAIVIVDDSLSTATGRGESRFAAMKELASAYVDTLEEGDEISLFAASDIGGPLPDPLYDLEAVKARIADMEPSAAATDVPALLEKALDLEHRHLNPELEVVLVTDGFDDGWNARRRSRWSDLRTRLGYVGEDRWEEAGDRARVVLLRPPPLRGIDDVGVAGIELDRGVIAAGTTIQFRVRVARSGDDHNPDALLRLAVDGEQIEERRLGEFDGRDYMAVFEHSFEEPGSHVVQAKIVGARDDLARDDTRYLGVEVRESIRVLLVEEGGDGEDLFARPLGLFEAALDPTGDGEGFRRPERIAAADMARTDLDEFEVVVLGDIPALDSDAIAALERYLVSGGSILVGLGPSTEPELVNRFWARDGDGFLPAPLGELRRPEPEAIPETANLSHPVLSAFRGDAAAEWRRFEVRAHFDLDFSGIDRNRIGVVMSLGDGSPLLVERERGLGRVMLWTSSFDLRWSEPQRAPFVPLVRGMVDYLAGEILPSRNLLPGERLVHDPRGTFDQVRARRGEEVVPLEEGIWEGRDVLRSPPLSEAGVIRIEDEGGVTHYTVNPTGEETRLALLERSTVDETLGGLELIEAEKPAEVGAFADDGGERGAELWRYLVLGALALLFVESWITRRQSRRERGAPVARPDSVEEVRRAA